ncbi:FKBP-type peptidyl-prolyl cis-trans isomerase, partial [bacterium]|nr:FKBP-type peptidyl-prolyl cis-trans isomerase [bacterium]
TPEMDVQQAQAIISEFFQALQEKASEATINEGKSFLVENAKRSEVVTLESGLQYEVITAGTGETPVASDKVKVHYHGTLINGTVFDS